MAKDDKTEKPTPKRKRESRQKGQVAKSQDLTGWVSLLVGLYLVPLTVGRIADVVTESMSTMRTTSEQPSTDLAVRVFADALRGGLVAIAPLLVAAAMTAIAVTMGQTGLILSGKPLKPDFKRISPKQGFKRLFSIRSSWETVKQVLKITVVVAVAWPRIVDLVEDLAGNGRLGLDEGLPAAGSSILGLARTVAWTVVVLSVADYGYQRYQNAKDMKMSKQEVKDEYKNAEGDGMVKGRIRAMQRSMARNRMLAGVADADVVITNPTHISVALKYDPAKGRAPIVIASGANTTAATIRERARDASIPIVEAKPLARALWRACDAGDEIPPALYEAVAQVLAFVRRLDKRLSEFGRQLQLPPHLRPDEDELDAIPRKKRRL